jgi:hypothetical protein
MENIFDFLNSILFSKQKKSLTCDNNTAYLPFMVNRWCSFYSKDLANIINITTNRFLSFSKEEHFTFLKNFLPKFSFKRIDYVRKKNTDNKEENPEIAMLAKNLELSKREINHYIICQKYL